MAYSSRYALLVWAAAALEAGCGKEHGPQDEAEGDGDAAAAFDANVAVSQDSAVALAHDGGQLAASDGSSPADAAAPAQDASSRDAAASCMAPVTDTSCEARLCSRGGDSWLAVDGDQQWYVGALEWGLALCGRPVGWARQRSDDLEVLGFRLGAQDLAELQAGTVAQVYYGGPGVQLQRCTVDTSAPLQECPFAGLCTPARKADVAALQERVDCLPCAADVGVDPCFGAGSCACWCSVRAPLEDACPSLFP